MSEDQKPSLRMAAIGVVRKAFFLLENTEDDGLDEMRIDRRDWDELSAAMDRLEELDPAGEYNCISAIKAALTLDGSANGCKP